jgi:hypothetical protein
MTKPTATGILHCFANQEMRLGFMTDQNFAQTMMWELEALQRKGEIELKHGAKESSKARTV